MSGGLNISALDIGLSLAAIGITLFLYEKGSKEFPGYTPKKGGVGDGIDPNWTKDPPVYDPGTGWKQPQMKLPNCQVWSDTYQLFVDAGCPECDQSESACFEKFTDDQNPRYLDSAGNISFRRKDPFNEPKAEWGTCFFWDGKNYTSFPNDSFLPNGEPFTPVNRSARLCFAADTPDLHPFQFVRASDGYQTFAPSVSWQNVAPAWSEGSVIIGGHTPGNPPSNAPICEELVQIAGVDDPTKPIDTVWAYTVQTAANTDIESCLGSSNPNPTRWNDQINRVFYFEDPISKKWLETEYNAMPGRP